MMSSSSSSSSSSIRMCVMIVLFRCKLNYNS
jgi:hypothetical protein